MLNRKQRIVLCCGGLLVLISFLFPPGGYLTYDTYGDRGIIGAEFTGYWFLFATSKGYILFPLLWTQLVVIAIAAIGLVIGLKDKK